MPYIYFCLSFQIKAGNFHGFSKKLNGLGSLTISHYSLRREYHLANLCRYIFYWNRTQTIRRFLFIYLNTDRN